MTAVAPGPGFPRPFVLNRKVDATGISGTGVVAQGVEFADGVVALRWLGDWPTSVVFHDRGYLSVEHVHGHGGNTEIVWLPDGALTQGREAHEARNRIAREVADLRDELADARKRCLEAEGRAAELDTERTVLTVNMEDAEETLRKARAVTYGWPHILDGARRKHEDVAQGLCEGWDDDVMREATDKSQRDVHKLMSEMRLLVEAVSR